jgi:polyisoprenoid-binding protein YceI
MKNQRVLAGASSTVSLVRLVVVAGSALAASTPARAADDALTNPSVHFTVTTSNGAKIHGAGADIRLETRGNWLIFRVPLSSIGTHHVQRDRQMRDRYLEADTHSVVELKIARETLKVPKGTGAGEGTAPAQLKLHGKSREVTVHYSLERQGENLRVRGAFDVDLRDHGIDVPSYHGVGVNPKVAVTVSFGTVDREVVAEAASAN